MVIVVHLREVSKWPLETPYNETTFSDIHKARVHKMHYQHAMHFPGMTLITITSIYFYLFLLAHSLVIQKSTQTW